MSSTQPVPETRLMADDELSADDAWQTLRRHGGWHLLRDAFVRFRYGDGFSHARALGLQLCLAVVPFLIALTGLITDLGVRKGARCWPRRWWRSPPAPAPTWSPSCWATGNTARTRVTWPWCSV
ncbi:hypothetical protein GCM10027605_23270 [Micromonospora zhanjiangensis]